MVPLGLLDGSNRRTEHGWGRTGQPRRPRFSTLLASAPVTTIRGDNPVTEASDDALGRFPIAQTFVDQVLAVDASEGAVVGVLGRWGSGKTSFINFARQGFSERAIVVLDFNPWMFSGAEQLVDSFFIELAAQLRTRQDARLKTIASTLSDYGEAFSGLGWLPVAGPWIERSRGVAKYLSKMLARRNEGIGERKHALESALEELDKPIVVVLDDIDRLTTDEIRDVFKLVRLTASLPNIVYVLAFDRIRVERALDEQGISGRDYLEKIIQVTYDLPAPSKKAIAKQLFSLLDDVLGDLEVTGPFDQDVWPDIAAEIVLPLICTMRDVRRYVAAIHGTVLSLEGRVALQDVLAMEAVRIFMPDVYSAMSEAVGALTNTESASLRTNADYEKEQIEGILEAGAAEPVVVRALIERLFPPARSKSSSIGGSGFGPSWSGSWLTKRRVANEDVLRVYFEKVRGDELAAFENAELLWNVLDDNDALQRGIEAIDLVDREDVIRSLEAFEQEFRPEHVVPGVVVLLNQLPKLPERERGLFDPDTRLSVGRVVYRLIRSLDTPDAIESAVREALPQIESLSSQFELITDVGYREGAGHKLVTEAAAKALEDEWAERVAAASVDDLLGETDLLRTLYWAGEILGTDAALDVEQDPNLTLQIFRTARTYTRTQSAESRAIRRSFRLPWSTVESVLGTESEIRARVESIDRTGLSEEDLEILELADKYLGGWRPKEFGDDE